MATLDTSIYRQSQPQGLMDILGAYEEADARKARNEYNQLALAMRKQELADSRAARERQGRLSGLMATFGADSTPEQRSRGLRGAGFWQEADAVVKADLEGRKTTAEIGKVTADADKARIAAALDRFNAIGQIMSGVKDQATYDNARRLAAETFGAEAAANLPPQYDPAVIEQRRVQALTVQEQLTQQLKLRQQEETERNNRAQTDATLRGQDMSAATARRGQDISASTTRRGQDMADARSREANNSGTYDADRGVVVNPRTGEAKPVLGPGGQPLAPKKPSEATAKVTEAKEAIALIDQADQLIGKATGSFVGKGIDLAGRAVGLSTPGAEAAAQLKALEGALVAKMPKMSGPQSDKDVQLYRQMAGMIGDETVPAEQKRAALRTVREIQERYAGVPAGSSAPNPRSSGGTVKNQALEDALNKYR